MIRSISDGGKNSITDKKIIHNSIKKINHHKDGFVFIIMIFIYSDKWLIWLEKDYVKALSSDKNIRLKLKIDKKIDGIKNIVLMKQWIDKLEKIKSDLVTARKVRNQSTR